MAEEENYATNLMRMVAAELHVLNLQTAAREMFGRGYFSLGWMEKQAVDNSVWGTVQGIHTWATSEALAQATGAEPPRNPVGFGTPPTPPQPQPEEKP